MVLAIVSSHISTAQITISQNDFASAGTDILVSNGSIIPGIDITTTGANQVWDFSMLTPFNQDTLQFLDVANTASVYALYFANVGFNPNRANIATASPPIPTIPGVPIAITDPYNFYYKSSSSYKQVGIGAAINGFTTPIAFNNKDFIYNFPVNFGDMDSCNSDYAIALTGFAYYGHEQKRVNNVDGWGSITTPYGTFSALRIKSEINARDTFYLDTLGFGYGLDLPTTVEYKWIANGHDIPVLQINTNILFGLETVTSIVYPDSLRLTGLLPLSHNNNFLIYPNPSSNSLYIQYDEKVKTSLEILNSIGEIVLKKEMQVKNSEIDISNLSPGIYYARLITAKGSAEQKFIKAD